MASGYEDFIFEEDFDAIMAVLEEDESLECQFHEAVQEVQRQDIACSICQKVCKSKRGLSIHMNAKHKENDEEDIQEQSGQRTAFTADILIDLVNDLKTTISKKKVFTTAMREEISSYRFNISEGSKELEVLQSIFDGLTKNGNAEKFYSKYYANIALHATTYFPELSRNSSTLLATKLADRLLAYRKESLSPVDIDEIKKPLQEKEISGLQYLGGYVLQNLHNKHRSSKNWKSTESQQAMSLLTACKEESSKINESQKLIKSLTRGGLWNPTKKAQKIFTRAEHYFRNNKTGQCQRFININIMVENCCKDTEVVAFFNDIVSESSLEIDKRISKDMLHNIINLFLHVRSFSFAKDVIQNHKIKQKQVKAKSLRKEIKRASGGKDDREP
ncbi:uncharacterized protein [Acropora muricata]|uniref:uncharacterized protein n=1 Tax=Acropora muricata TaxID=159855 RepID=UPI0034E416D0